MLFVLLTGFTILYSSDLFSQEVPFGIELEEVQINQLGGLQSFAVGQHNGKWLVVGGRLDGLHRRQPWAAFDLAGHNNQVFVIDPVNEQVWTSPLSVLNAGLAEQLRSTNMQFHQSVEYLYVTGGYGRSDIENDHVTFNLLTAINVPGAINAVVNQQDISPYFQSLAHEQFRVAGGHLKKLGEVFYLVGGNKFMGRYNPRGPNFGPGFVQEYTNAVRRFTVNWQGDAFSVDFLEPYEDAENLHRRDFNVTPQIFPNGQEGLTAFSGVFQHNLDLPFLNSVDITAGGYTVNDDFTQYYNHYHCANIPLYDAEANEMHTLFFGGIAQFYDEGGVLIQDDDVPFVRTIARVTRSADGSMAEYKLPIEMPDLLGAGSEFIVNESLPKYSNNVIKLNELEGDTILLGYIYGGISSSAPNIFFVNDGTQSTASSEIFKVFLLKSAVTGIHQVNPHSISTLKTLLYPNPNNGKFLLEFNLVRPSQVTATIHSVAGQLVETVKLGHNQHGMQYYTIDLVNRLVPGHYLIKLKTDYEESVQRLVVRE